MKKNTQEGESKWSSRERKKILKSRLKKEIFDAKRELKVHDFFLKTWDWLWIIIGSLVGSGLTGLIFWLILR